VTAPAIKAPVAATGTSTHKATDKRARARDGMSKIRAHRKALGKRRIEATLSAAQYERLFRFACENRMRVAAAIGELVDRYT
jgi:ribosomal protein L19E